jgi:lysophospholipase L1-like esterase
MPRTGTLEPVRRLAVMLGGAALALVAAELVMRHYAFAPRVVDREFGFVPQPGVTVHWHAEGSGHGHWNAHGIRRQDNPPGAPALLVLGDSITEAMQVDDDQTFSARLSVALRNAGQPMAVQNAGMAGASIARYAALAPRYDALLSPRWTVVQFDDEDLSKALSPLETHFVRDTPGGPLRIVELALGHGGAARLRTRELRARSALIQQLVLQSVGFAGEWRRWTPFRADAPVRSPAPAPGGELPVEEELDAVAGAYRGRVTFLYMAAFDPARPERSSDLERRVEEICERRGFSLVNLRRTFPDFARRGAAPYGLPNGGFNVGHLNPEGHQAVAAELAREIERLAAGGLL